MKPCTLPGRLLTSTMCLALTGSAMLMLAATPARGEQEQHRTEWMQQAPFGLMVHWIAPGPTPLEGEYVNDLNQAVDAFDLDRFMRDFEATGAGWLIFTIGQNTAMYASPNAVLDKLAGPGHCSQRDLVLEIAERVHALGKRFIAYLPAEVNAPEKLHAPFAWNPKDQSEFQRRYTDFIREYAVRLGDKLAGWWFDGCYTWDVFPNSTYLWPLWFDAARAGNPNAIVAFNDGSFCIGITTPVTPLQDYLSGEVDTLVDGKIRLGRNRDAQGYLPEARFAPGTQTQWHALLPIDCNRFWAHTPKHPMTPSYPDAELAGFLQHCRSVGGVVTFNVGISQEGALGADTVAQLARLAAAPKSATP